MSVLAAILAAALQLQLSLPAEDGRTVPVEIYAPRDGCSECTLIIFSHGNFAAPDRYEVLLDSWASHGFVVAAPLHTDSEDYPDGDRYADSMATRISDWVAVTAAMDDAQIPGITLSGRVIAAGHSYGALIAQLAGGARLVEDRSDLKSMRRPDAIVALSPPGIIPDLTSAEGYSSIGVPMLLVTGTADTLPGFIERWETHLDAFNSASDGMAHALIFDSADHYFNGAFGRIKPEGAASADMIEALNTCIIEFAEKAGTDAPDPAEKCGERSTGMFEIRANQGGRP